MKNNRTFFTFVLMMLNAQSFASAPAQIEGQPGAMPPGGISFSSSSALVKIYKDQGTQTEISAQDDEQVTSQVCHMISLNNIHELTMKRVNNALQSIQAKAKSGCEDAIAALALFNQFISKVDMEVSIGWKGAKMLKDNGLLSDTSHWTSCCLQPSIRDAFKAKNILK